MSKLINAVRSKLIWYLLSYIVLAGVIAVGCSYGLSQLGTYYVENTFDDQEVNRRFQMKYITDLQEFIILNGITLDDISGLDRWAMENQYVYFSVYYNNTVIFNSDYVYSEDGDTDGEDSDIGDVEAVDIDGGDIEAVDIEVGDVEAGDLSDENSKFGYSDTGNFGDDTTEYVLEDGLDSSPLLSSDYLYQLKLADDTAVSVDMFCYDYWNYNYYVFVIAGLAGVIIFVVIFTRGIRRKLLYINQLEQELRILEGGNLEYPITVKGIDELGKLANGIDQMRLSIIDNQRQEEKILQANKDLVTAMSHDLRTPLTTLTGYLEILNMNNMSDNEKKRHYLELSLDKTREIKELSDELFEYFLVYEEDNRKIDLEPVPAASLVEDLIENQFLSLEEEGFIISGVNDLKDDSINCLINPRYMRRVLNNILSNLFKYAEKGEPIEVTAFQEEDNIVIKVRNVISTNLDRHESTKIGLVTCERIMKLHHGEFQYFESEGDFVVKLVIPVEK